MRVPNEFVQIDPSELANSNKKWNDFILYK